MLLELEETANVVLEPREVLFLHVGCFCKKTARKFVSFSQLNMAGFGVSNSPVHCVADASRVVRIGYGCIPGKVHAVKVLVFVIVDIIVSGSEVGEKRLLAFRQNPLRLLRVSFPGMKDWLWNDVHDC